MRNTFIWEQLNIPEDIVGDDVEHNPNQHRRNSRGDKEGVCIPEQENLEEQAKQDNEKPIKKERRNMNMCKCEQSWSRKHINLEEKKELRILIAGTSLCQHVLWVHLVTVNFAENLTSDNVMIM